jgi:hypothetical protein
MKANPNAPATSLVSEDAVKANRRVFLNEDGTPKTAAGVYNSQTRDFYAGSSTNFAMPKDLPTAADPMIPRIAKIVPMLNQLQASPGVPKQTADWAKQMLDYYHKAMEPTEAIKNYNLEAAQERAAGRVPKPFEKWLADSKVNTPAEVEARKKAAADLGLDPKSDNTKTYILTGKMPREDQQPLSATDKKAILEADEGVLAAQQSVDALKQAKVLSKKAYEGPFAAQRGYVTSLGGSEAGTTTTDLNNLVMGNALSQMKAIFGGNPTEGERKVLLDIQGSSSQPDAVRQKIYDRGIALAEKRLEFNKQRSNELRSMDFYKVKKAAAEPAAPGAPAAPAAPAATQPAEIPPPPDGFKLVQ